MRKYLIAGLVFIIALTGIANSFTTIEGMKYSDTSVIIL